MKIKFDFNDFTIDELIASYAIGRRYVIEDGVITKVIMEFTTATNEK